MRERSGPWSPSRQRRCAALRASGLLGIAAAVLVPAISRPWAFAMRARMPLPEAWKVLGLKPSSTRADLKKAFRQKIREVHPDVTGDDGTMLQRVRDAYAVVEGIENPSAWDQGGLEDGLPAWAAGLLQGVPWTADCPSYAAFLEKPDRKALAVGEMDQAGVRPWAAAWGKYSQEEANAEALRVCRQYGAKCKLIYVGTGTARARQAVELSAGQDEKEWWYEQFQGAGDIPGFGWMPMINPEKEKLVGYKTIPGGDRFGVEKLVRVPVFRLVTGSLPYYYSPLRPRERIHMKKMNFKHIRKLTGKKIKHDPRLQRAREATTSHNTW